MQKLRAIIAVLVPLTAAHAQAPKRQPAPTMGVEGAPWLVRSERIQEEDPDRMLSSLGIKKGSVIADIGAGVGYHTWRLADKN